MRKKALHEGVVWNCVYYTLWRQNVGLAENVLKENPLVSLSGCCNEEKSFVTLTSGIIVINFFSICNDPCK
jgi:hypothetical protein